MFVLYSMDTGAILSICDTLPPTTEGTAILDATGLTIPEAPYVDTTGEEPALASVMPDPADDALRDHNRRRALVNAERDRRINAGIVFNGRTFQSGPDSRENIAGAAAMAHIALTIGGAVPGDYRWHGGTEDFAFYDVNNEPMLMDAPTVIQFGQMAGAWKSAHITTAIEIKKMVPIPENVDDDQWWPT